MYEGRTSVERGKVLGHENLGEVIEVGGAVVRVKVETGSACRQHRVQYLRVPFVDYNCLRLPEDAAEKKTTTSCSPISSRQDGTRRGSRMAPMHPWS
jgi:glutathione-independent formaldehyde dehydrogenase